MRFGSVCSGIEAASVAWHPLGWKAAWLSEIEPFPSAVLKHHYPDVPNLGDMTTLPERILSGEVEAPDVFCGGTPCQAFSVAGLRKSLDDARGNLSLTFVGIANAIDHVRSVRSANPAIIFWENVPGVLNTKDNAFGCFLAGLAGEDDPLVPAGPKWTNAGCVFGPQRTVAWRILDAQYFGVAQRRRRVFVVASAREGFDPVQVLLVESGLRRDFAPSRETREDVTAGTTAGVASRSWPAEISSTLDTTFGTKQGLENQHVNAGCPLFVPAISPLTASMSTPLGNGGKDAFITAVMQPIAFDAYNNSVTGDVSKTLDVGQDHHHVPLVMQPIAFRGQMSNPHTDVDIMQTLQAKNPMAVAFNIAPGKGELKDDIHVTYAHISKTIDASGSNPSMHQGGAAIVQMMAVGTDLYNGNITGDVAATMGTPGSSINASGPTVMQAMQVRRLTPVECERLQGFPDNYTDIKAKGKPTPDGPRYKALGNSWAVPVVRWIGSRIQEQVDAP